MSSLLPKLLSACLLASYVGLAVSQQPANPIQVSSAQFLGPQRSNDYVVRDGGAEGNIGNTYFQIYADTAFCPNSSLTGCGLPYGLVPNTIAAQSYLPTRVTDYDSPYPSTFCSEPQGSGGRLHMANMISLDDSHGAVWYINLTTGPGCEFNGCGQTGGAASVQMQNGRPVCTPLFPGWDLTQEPAWGGTAALGPALDGYIYLLGALDGRAPNFQYGDVFIARAPNGGQFDYRNYQYWDGSAFTSQRLINPVSNNGAAPAAILSNTSISSWFYNTYYNKYIAITAPTGNRIDAFVANSPQGPYSAPKTIYFNSSYDATSYNGIYLPTALPGRDPSGKTLYITASYKGTTNVDFVVKLNFQ